MRNRTTFMAMALVIFGAAAAHAAQEGAEGGNPLEVFAEEALIGTYAELDRRAGELVDAVTKLAAGPGEAGVEAARKAWIDARVPWEHGEAFLFGPVDTEGHDPELDSWPVNVEDLKKVIDAKSGPEVLDEAAVSALGEGAKGFHVIEYLLFSDADGKPADAGATVDALKNSPRRLQYLEAAAAVFRKRTQWLLEDYRGEDGFAAQLATAGQEGGIYGGTASAYEEIVNGMIGIADESASEKILAPVEANDPGLLESRFSGNTLEDVLSNIDGIALSYEKAIAPNLSVKDAGLHAEILGAIRDYQSAVEEIPAPLNANLEQGAAKARRASEAGLALRDRLEQSLLPVVKGW